MAAIRAKRANALTLRAGQGPLSTPEIWRSLTLVISRPLTWARGRRWRRRRKTAARVEDVVPDARAKAGVRAHQDPEDPGLARSLCHSSLSLSLHHNQTIPYTSFTARTMRYIELEPDQEDACMARLAGVFLSCAGR